MKQEAPSQCPLYLLPVSLQRHHWPLFQPHPPNAATTNRSSHLLPDIFMLVYNQHSRNFPLAAVQSVDGVGPGQSRKPHQEVAAVSSALGRLPSKLK